MEPRKGRPRTQNTVLLSGWLFADLLLALAVIFMAANTVGIKPKPIPTPIPTVIPSPTLSPSPTPLPRLEIKPYRFTYENIDFQGLLNNSPSAINDLEQRLRSEPILQGRRVGLAVAYGGAPDDSTIRQALNIAQTVYGVLAKLGKTDPVFAQTVVYDPLYIFGPQPTQVVVDVFLFAR
jgi:hypothetical protein